MSPYHGTVNTNSGTVSSASDCILIGGDEAEDVGRNASKDQVEPWLAFVFILNVSTGPSSDRTLSLLSYRTSRNRRLRQALIKVSSNISDRLFRVRNLFKILENILTKRKGVHEKQHSPLFPQTCIPPGVNIHNCRYLQRITKTV